MVWVGKVIFKSVDEIKFFGVFMLGSFNAMMKRNWDVRFDEFRSAVFAWDGRMITSLDQRVMVLKTFALSRIWYLAALLPIRDSMINKMNGLMGKFRIGRVSLRIVL